MATQFEIQQAQEQKRIQERTQTSAFIGTIIQLVGNVKDDAGSLVSAIGGLIIGLAQFRQAKKEEKRQKQLTEHRKFISSNMESILDQLQAAGNDLINQGFNPMIGDFEQALYTILYPKIGYLGNCNINVWIPAKSNEPDKQAKYVAAQPLNTWFTIKNGSLISTPALIDAPPNIETYWTGMCRNIHDSWLMAYQDQLIAQGRIQEAQALKASTSKSVLTWQIIFGMAVTILIVMIFFRSARIK